MGKKVVLDIVFHAQSLNYDQGGSNYQELKKVSTWDGFNHVLASRYALRYSLLETLKESGFPIADGKNGNLQLSGSSDKNGVVQVNPNILQDATIKNFPEFFFFGFLITKAKTNKRKGEEPTTQGTENGFTIQKPAAVKISHAISMNPYRNSPLFYANLGMMKRINKQGSNPFTSEEHLDFYIYNITMDIDQMKQISYIADKGDEQKIELAEDEFRDYFGQLLEAVFNLKRNIKGRTEDLSPWVSVIGLYNEKEPIDIYKDRIYLNKKHTYEVARSEESTKPGSTLIKETIEEGTQPSFTIHDSNKRGEIKIYHRKYVDVLCQAEKTNDEESVIKRIIDFVH